MDGAKICSVPGSIDVGGALVGSLVSSVGCKPRLGLRASGITGGGTMIVFELCANAPVEKTRAIKIVRKLLEINDLFKDVLRSVGFIFS